MVDTYMLWRIPELADFIDLAPSDDILAIDDEVIVSGTHVSNGTVYGTIIAIDYDHTHPYRVATCVGGRHQAFWYTSKEIEKAY